MLINIRGRQSFQTKNEINYFGKNGFLHGRFVKKNHVMEAGINYNFSDGFSDNPVLGVGVYYGYQISTSKNGAQH